MQLLTTSWSCISKRKKKKNIRKYWQYIHTLYSHILSQDIRKNNLVESCLNVWFPRYDHIRKNSIDFISGIKKGVMPPWLFKLTVWNEICTISFLFAVLYLVEKLSFVIKFVSVGTSRRCGGSRDQFLVVNSWTKHLLEYPDFELDLMNTLILNHKIYWDSNTVECSFIKIKVCYSAKHALAPYCQIETLSEFLRQLTIKTKCGKIPLNKMPF